MNMNERIARINELYHKSKGEGLTPEEKEEQAKLRREYIDSIKNNLRSQLDNINIQNEDGSITNLGKKFGNK
jgi:5-formyltetrahydrofolate cyclo-ligase